MSQKPSSKAAVVIPFKKQSTLSDPREFASCLETCLLLAKQTGLRLGVYVLRLNVARQRNDDDSLSKLIETVRDHVSHQLPSFQLVGQPWSDGLAIIDASAQSNFEMHQKAAKLIDVVQSILGGPNGKSSPRASLGISIYPSDGDESATLLDRAHAASERAAGWPLSGFCFFSPLTGKSVAKRLAEEGAMLHSLRSNMVGVEYHPIVDVSRCRVVGALAEPKWCHPGEHPPLVDLAHADLADAYSAWIAESASGQRPHGGEARQQKISIQAYPSQIAGASLVAKLSAALRHKKISPDLVDIRFDAAMLTEATDHRSRNGLQKLADLGVTLTAMNVDGALLPVDALTKLPLSTIEFSVALPQIIGRCSKFETKQKALIQFLHALGLRTRAVGVESKQQLTFLTDAGCDEVSGQVVGGKASRRWRGR